ncbi:MAG: 30S ribosomal protein S16 [Verrucomicrobiota bacterium JB022]|nr:30S ribosomal protein S16 [Verrucomicrobiota bacterium JB022]
MALKIRLQRGGATHNPHYRIVVAESSNRRDGRFVERIGSYDPRNGKPEQRELLNLERAEYWMSVGAQPSDTVRSIIKRARAAAKAAPAAAEAQA